MIYARTYYGRTHHIVVADKAVTYCGKSTAEMAVFDGSYIRGEHSLPTCTSCARNIRKGC